METKKTLLKIPYPLPTSAVELGVLREKLVARVAELDQQLAGIPKSDGRRHALVGEKTSYQGHLKAINKALAAANRKANSPVDASGLLHGDWRRGSLMPSTMGTVATVLDVNPDGVPPMQRWLLTIAAALLSGDAARYRINETAHNQGELDEELLRKEAESVLNVFAPEFFNQEDFSATPDQIEAARETHGEEGIVEFDDDAQMSKDDDDEGVWVQGWLYLEEDPSPIVPRWEQDGVEDKDLSAEELDDKYNPDGDGEHPKITREAWRGDVANGDTALGYWQWLVKELNAEG